MEEKATAATELTQALAEYCAAGLEALGTGAIVSVALFMTALSIVQLVRREPIKETFTRYRHGLIRGTLLGLEILVAADIIKTVAIEFDISGVTTLAILVLIRTFLSFTLEVELHGRWPWQAKEDEASAA